MSITNRNKLADQHTATLLLLTMLYMTIMLANAVLTKKWIIIGNHFVFGGAFISPFLFILGDIIAELYGYSFAKKIIIFGFICQTLFAIIVQYTIQLSSPIEWHEQHSFNAVFDSIVRIDLSGLLAYLVACTLNAKLITRWKALLHGKYFGLRSIGASTISEACYSGIAIIMIGFGSLPFKTMLSIVLISYIIKLIFSTLCAYPTNILVSYLKSRLQLSDTNTLTLNPFPHNTSNLSKSA